MAKPYRIEISEYGERTVIYVSATPINLALLTFNLSRDGVTISITEDQ
jgi:hypothetical protein